MLALHLDVAAQGEGADDVLGALAVPGEEFGAEEVEADGELLDEDAVAASHQVVAELVDEDDSAEAQHHLGDG